MHMGNASQCSARWIGGRGLAFDLFLLAMPWLYVLITWQWGYHYGDRLLYDWCILQFNWLIGAGSAALALVRLALRRQDMALLIFCIPSSMFAAALTPMFERACG